MRISIKAYAELKVGKNIRRNEEYYEKDKYNGTLL